ncbi:C2H2 type zinc finger domain protein [Aspergillus homomorphus CBS 101889]|uniref:C2H2 type zinc finger domain protein n=1 Tax=Aspergillus homomorphus (strain CBS 101889) TaxID=1450537 RepID=A0A395HXF0_ASPHC|nr:C2H2 type zinc finger domain protein [Aspergillus homomorphus CBS 101889]RAL12073.1 C2H2 type zinc finger domain protein [Aspergillus homomorphus CBS 101889]
MPQNTSTSTSSPTATTPTSKTLVCRVCEKGFSKAEHLRRHERCHTGSKPFVCKECRRPFARQDALTRHEKLHVRAANTKQAQANQSAVHVPSQAPPLDTLAWDTTRATAPEVASTSTSNNTWETSQAEQHSGLQHAGSDLDFTLIWPDSENLFQSIMACDTTDQWQMPLGALPFPPVVQDVNGMNFGSPNSFDDRGASIGAIPSGGSHQAVRDVTEMVTSSSSSVTAAIKATSITSVFLDECLHMFFVRFIPTFPILHRATFVFRECTHPLLLNAMALGSLYLGPKDSVSKGEALWRLAHTAIATSWQSLITHRGPYDACKGVQLLLTALLGQIYGALSKNRQIRTTSQVFRPLGFFWARHCGMLDCEPFPMESVPFPSASISEKENRWRTWVAREIQQRALLAYHILDGLVAQMSGDGASTRHVANPLILPSSEAAFDAGNVDEWITTMRSQRSEQPSFRLVFRSLFPPIGSFRPLDYQFSAFALRVVLEGLQSLVSDSDESDLAAVGVPGRSDVRRALAQVHETITMSIHLSAPERLEVLLRWHTICLDTMINSTILCRHVCSRYDITQHVSGGSRTIRPGFDMVKWVNTEDARRALLHAIAIQDIVEQLPRGRAHVIHMPSSLFSATTIYVVFSLAGVTNIHLPRTVVWQDALLSRADLNIGSDTIRSSTGSETRRFVEEGRTDSPPGMGAVRNLLYEMNSLQKLFRCLFSQWGIAHDMEEIIDQWITLCH